MKILKSTSMKKQKLIPAVSSTDPVTGATSVTIFDTRYDKLVAGLLIETTAHGSLYGPLMVRK